MKKLLFLISIAVSINIFSQQTKYALQIIDTLSSEYFSGRGYVNNGMGKAANYLSEEFKKHGLLSFSTDYFQGFDLPVNTFPENMQLIINGEELIAGIDFVIDPASPGSKGDFRVTKVRAKELLNQSVLKKLLSKSSGKYIVIDKRGLEIDKTEQDKLNQIIQYLKYNQELTVAGVIELVDHKLSWYPSTQLGPRPVFVVNAPIDLKKINTIGVDVNNKFIQDYSCSNVIGYFKGSSQPDSFIVITAHYDHLGMMGNRVMFPGANDNASGIAMMLNLAKHYSVIKPKYSIVFIALAAEESGLLGAKYYVENPLFDLSNMKFLINIDLAGTGDEGIKVVNGSVYKDKFDLLSNLNIGGQYLPAVKVRGEACNSDHCMFYRKGVPCFFIYTLGGNPAYHDIYDVPENLPLDKFHGYKQLMIEFIDSL